MRAYRLLDLENVVKEEIQSQSVGETCVKIKILYCCISSTDRLLYSGKIRTQYPITLGRGAVGMVVEVGQDVKNFVRGDIVALKSMAVCSDCIKCNEKKFNDCENMLTFGMNEDGFLSDFAVVSYLDIVKLPEWVNPKEAVFMDHIDMAIETISRLDIEKGQYIVISGATSLGIILAQIAIYYQIVPILVDINQPYLDIASSLGVYYSVNSSEVDTKKKIFALTGGKMADAVVYISDSNYPFAQTIELVKRCGKVAIAGFKNSKQELNSSFTPILNKELNVFGIAESNKNTASAINMLANKTVKVEPLIGEEIAFDSVEKELKKEVAFDSVYLKTIVKI